MSSNTCTLVHVCSIKPRGSHAQAARGNVSIYLNLACGCIKSYESQLVGFVGGSTCIFFFTFLHKFDFSNKINANFDEAFLFLVSLVL